MRIGCPVPRLASARSRKASRSGVTLHEFVLSLAVDFLRRMKAIGEERVSRLERRSEFEHPLHRFEFRPEAAVLGIDARDGAHTGVDELIHWGREKLKILMLLQEVVQRGGVAQSTCTAVAYRATEAAGKRRGREC